MTVRIHAWSFADQPPENFQGANLVSRSASGDGFSCLLENLVHHRNCDRAFSNRRGNALHVARTYISHGKHSRKTGFEQKRPTRQRPARRHQIAWKQIYARLDESFFVERQTARKPGRVRIRSRHQENVPDVAGLQAASLIVTALHAVQAVSSLQSNDLRVRVQGDGATLLNPANQVARHGVRQASRADHDVDMLCRLRQKYRRLTGGIAATHNYHFFAPAQLRLQECGAVVDAIAFESLQVFEREFAVFGSGGDDNRSSRQSRAAINFDKIRTAPAVEADRATSDYHSRAEFLRLG